MSEEKLEIDPRDARIVELLGELNGWKMRCSALERELSVPQAQTVEFMELKRCLQEDAQKYRDRCECLEYSLSELRKGIEERDEKLRGLLAEDELEAANGLNAADILDEAHGIVTGTRQSTYGEAERSFDLIARFWNTYLYGIGYVGALAPHNVAIMMSLLKTARLCRAPLHRDSWVDGAGYFALGAECALGEENTHESD